MPSPLRLLVLEDRAADAELMLHELQRAGFAADWRRVETEADYVAALDPAIDLILADYSLPQFNALRALQLLQQRGLDIPFIIVTGSISEEVAVECMKQGAADYLLKDRMTRLGQAVALALEQKRLRVENQRAAEALRASEQKYRKLHESMIDGFVYVDMQGNIIDSNPSYQQMLGYSFEELTRLTYRDLTPEKWHAAEQAILDEQVLPRGYSDIYQKEYRRKDGTVFPIEIHAFLIKNEAGENEGMWAIVRDITERQRAERALRESEAKFRDMAEQVIDVLFVSDTRGFITYISPSAARVFGWQPTEMIGQNFVEFLSEAEIPRALEQFRASIELGRPNRRLELDMKRWDGSLFSGELNASTLIKEGRAVGTIGLIRDITERKRTAEALRESEERFRSLYENSTVGLYRTTPDGRILFANPTLVEMLGYSSFDELATRILEQEGYEPGHNRTEFLEVIERQGEVKGRESGWTRQDGIAIFVRESARAIRDPQGKTLYYDGSVEDITERKQAEEALQASERRERERAAELQTIMDTVPATIWIAHDQMSQVITGNRAAYELLRVPPGSNASLTAPEGQRPTHSKICQNGVELPPNDLPIQISAATGVEIHDFEEAIVFDDGTVIHQLGNVMPLFDEEGRPRGAVGAFIDITERKRAEDALRESEERFSKVFHASPVAISVTTLAEARFVEVNDSFLKLVGQPSREEVIGRSVLELNAVSPEYRASLAQALWAHGRASNVEAQFDTLAGEKRDVLASLELIELNGQACILTLAHDITERKRAEEALRASEERYRMLAENMSDTVWLMDMNLRNIYISPSVVRTRGYTLDELNALPLDRQLTPESLSRITQAMAEELSPEMLAQPDLRITRTLEVEFYRKDGSAFWSENSLTLIRDEQGHPINVLGTGRDITERKRAEEALRETQARLQHLLAASPVVIYSITPDFAATWVSQNVEHVLGYTVAESQAPGWWADHLHPDDRQRVLAEMSDVSERAQYVHEYRFQFKDSSYHWIHDELRLIRDAQGNLLEIVGAWHDITARKRAEEALREKVATLQALAEIDREIIAATEPQGILDLVCRRVAELVRAPKSVIAIEGSTDRLEVKAHYGLTDPARASQEFAQFWQAGMLLPVIHEARATIAVNDVPAGSSHMPEFQASENIRALAIVRLAAGEEILGALAVFDTAPREWNADELEALGLLAGQTAIALEKLRLLQAARSRALHLATLNEIGQAITSSLDLDRVLVALLEKVRQATDAEACSVALVDKAAGDLVFRQAVGGATHSVIGLRLQPGQGIAGWVALHGQSILVPDAASDARAYKLDDSSGFVTRDLIGVPLMAHDAVIGVIELINKRSGRFSEEDVRLLESVAAQAAIVIENARLFETEHAGRQSLETLYRIGQAINSTLDADIILDRLTDEAMRATHATHGSALVARPDRGCFERRSLRGYSPEEAERARSDWLPLDRGVNGRAYRLRQVVYVGDVSNDPDYHPLVPGTRSELAVPIIRGGQVIGNLDLQSPEVDAFREVNLDFLGALTDQVAIALENARLYEETRRQIDEMSIVSQVALVGAAGRPFDETVARATNALSRLWPEASIGFLFVDEVGQALHLHPAYHDASPLIITAASVPVDQGLTGWAVRERQPIRVGNVTADPRYLLTTPDIRSEMAAPLVVGQRAIGVVDVQSSWLDAFSGDDLRLLTTLAGQLATIFEKARLDAELVDHAALLEQRVEERTAQVRREQARTQAILDALGEGVVVTDPEGTIQYVNPAMEQVTGYSANESIGQNPRLWQSGQTAVAVYREMWDTILASKTWHGEIVNRRKDGEFYFASIAAAPILSAGGSHDQLAGFVGVQRDITERIQAEEEMRRALEKEKELNNLKSNFVSLTSHEFRTPLTTILSSAEMLEYYSAGWTTERKHEHLHRIQTAVEYMTALLNDILIIGKAEAGKLEFMPTPLDLVKFCRDLVEELQLADTAKHVLIFNGQVECAQVSMDEHLLRHTLSNLLSNAIKYSPSGSIIQFELACREGQAVFQISDQGIGIPPEDRAHLFETFHRAANVRNIAGTGLGLAIVKRSVDLHGGTIDVASQVGVGTTVTVTLPLGVPRDE